MIKTLKQMQLIRIFSTEKIVRIKFLNWLGLQPFRILLADGLYRLRSKRITPKYESEIKEVLEHGMIKINNFLSDEEFKKIESECLELISDPSNFHSVYQDGPNKKSYVKLQEIDHDNYPAIKRYLTNDKVVSIFSAAERRELDLMSSRCAPLLEFLEQGEDDGSSYDPETDVHSDTFFNTHKAWLYLTDVEKANAPLTFFPDSHRLGVSKRLGKEYKYSWDTSQANRGSRRIPQEELQSHGLKESIVTVKKNTFVMANTFGYHRRIKGQAGRKRLAIKINVRVNPFDPRN